MRKRSLSSRISLLFAVGLWFASLASPAAAQPITFRFEGEYDPAFMPPPEYALDVGTPVHGEFSYDLGSVDGAVSNDDQGSYAQVEPYRLEFQVGDSIFFQTDYGCFLGYRILIENDDSHVLPTRDRFHIGSCDSELAASYGVDDVHASVLLQDLTAQALDDDSLPTDLSGFGLDAFGVGWLSLGGSNREGDTARVIFSYRFRIDVIERATPQPLFISSDIKPGSDRNVINPSSRGVVPVAVLGSMDFFVEDIDLTTLAFGPDFAPAAGGRHKDVNADGFRDLVVHFRTKASGIAIGDTEACLSGETLYGTPFSGCDTIRTTPGR